MTLKEDESRTNQTNYTYVYNHKFYLKTGLSSLL